MGELQVLVKQVAGKIEFNFEELRENLSSMMDLYKDAQFTEDTIIGAKNEVSALRKIKKALSDRRIEVKKECLKPYDEFEGKVKELTALIDEPIELIDNQLEKFEQKRISEKKGNIQSIYDEVIGEMKDYLPLTKIYDSKWENKGTSIKSIREEIEQVVSSTDMAVQTIKSMASESVDNALQQYRLDLSLSNAIAYINKYEQQKAEIIAREEQKHKEEEECKRLAEIERIKEEERKRVAEEERIREEERKKIELESAKKEESQHMEKEFIPLEDGIEDGITFLDEEPFINEEAFELPTWKTIKVLATIDELDQIKMFIESIGVEGDFINE